MSLSTIEPIDLWSSFATFKPFGLLFLNLQISQRFSLDTYFWRLLLSFEVSRIAQAANLSINVKKLIQFLATEFYNLIKYL